MLKNTVRFRWLIGLMLLASFTLSACAAQTRADAVPTEEPTLLNPPAAEGGEGVYIDSVEIEMLESWPVQFVALVRGNLADGCTTIEEIRVARTAEANLFEITIVTARDPEAMCTMALVPFEERISLDVDGLSAGTYTVEVDGVSATFELADVDGAFEMPAGEAGEGLFVDSVEALILESWPVQVNVVMRGNLADGCTAIVEYLVTHEEGSDLFEVTIGAYRDPDAMCTMALVPFEETISLNVEGLSAGTYTVSVHGVTTTFELAADNVSATE